MCCGWRMVRFDLGRYFFLKGSINMELTFWNCQGMKSTDFGWPVRFYISLECQNFFWEFQESSGASLGNVEEDSGGAGRSAVRRKPAGDLCGEAGGGQSCQRSRWSRAWGHDTWGKWSYFSVCVMLFGDYCEQKCWDSKTLLENFLYFLFWECYMLYTASNWLIHF